MSKPFGEMPDAGLSLDAAALRICRARLALLRHCYAPHPFSIEWKRGDKQAAIRRSGELFLTVYTQQSLGAFISGLEAGMRTVA